MENRDEVYGMGVGESCGNKFNSILHTRVLQIKAVRGHNIKKQVI